MKIEGAGLLLVGSGLYWVLAGPLIGWFSVVNPFQTHLSQLGLTLILVTGITCLTLGLWIIPTDLETLYRLFSRGDGWIFTFPATLAIADIYLTLIGLSLGRLELNPYVASAISIGSWAVIPFLVSYIALSEGLGLLMLSLGNWLFGMRHPWEWLPFTLVCAAASFGPLTNAGLLVIPGASGLSYPLGTVAVAGFSMGIYRHFRKQSFPRNLLFLGSAD